MSSLVDNSVGLMVRYLATVKMGPWMRGNSFKSGPHPEGRGQTLTYQLRPPRESPGKRQ